MANHEWSMPELQTKAEAYCAASEHCESDIRNKLRQWNATSEQCEQIINHLRNAQYIDDMRYCNAFVHDKLLYQGWGRVKMRNALQAKHLPEESIREAIENIDETEYLHILERIVKQKKYTRPEQLVRFCLQRGFTLSEIKHFVKLYD